MRFSSWVPDSVMARRQRPPVASVKAGLSAVFASALKTVNDWTLTSRSVRDVSFSHALPSSFTSPTESNVNPEFSDSCFVHKTHMWKKEKSFEDEQRIMPSGSARVSLCFVILSLVLTLYLTSVYAFASASESLMLGASTGPSVSRNDGMTAKGSILQKIFPHDGFRGGNKGSAQKVSNLNVLPSLAEKLRAAVAVPVKAGKAVAAAAAEAAAASASSGSGAVSLGPTGFIQLHAKVSRLDEAFDDAGRRVERVIDSSRTRHVKSIGAAYQDDLQAESAGRGGGGVLAPDALPSEQSVSADITPKVIIPPTTEPVLQPTQLESLVQPATFLQDSQRQLQQQSLQPYGTTTFFAPANVVAVPVQAVQAEAAQQQQQQQAHQQQALQQQALQQQALQQQALQQQALQQQALQQQALQQQALQQQALQQALPQQPTVQQQQQQALRSQQLMQQPLSQQAPIVQWSNPQLVQEQQQQPQQQSPQAQLQALTSLQQQQAAAQRAVQQQQALQARMNQLQALQARMQPLQYVQQQQPQQQLQQQQPQQVQQMPQQVQQMPQQVQQPPQQVQQPPQQVQQQQQPQQQPQQQLQQPTQGMASTPGQGASNLLLQAGAPSAARTEAAPQQQAAPSSPCDLDVSSCQKDDIAVQKAKKYAERGIQCKCQQLLLRLACEVLTNQANHTSSGSLKLDQPNSGDGTYTLTGNACVELKSTCPTLSPALLLATHMPFIPEQTAAAASAATSTAPVQLQLQSSQHAEAAANTGTAAGNETAEDRTEAAEDIGVPATGIPAALGETSVRTAASESTPEADRVQSFLQTKNALPLRDAISATTSSVAESVANLPLQKEEVSQQLQQQQPKSMLQKIEREKDQISSTTEAVETSESSSLMETKAAVAQKGKAKDAVFSAAISEKLLQEAKQQQRAQAEAIAPLGALVEEEPSSFISAAASAGGAAANKESVWVFATESQEQCKGVENVLPIPMPVDTKSERQMLKLIVLGTDDSSKAIPIGEQ